VFRAKNRAARTALVREFREDAGKGAKMIARITGTVLLSLLVFVVMSLLVSLGVVWLTDNVTRGAVIGVVCGLAAAFVISSVSTAVGRNEERPRRRSGDRSGGPEND
jgi:uncharacterized membrane protein (DUF485 family)